VSNPYPTRTTTAERTSDASFGELVAQITTDVSVLMRQELSLAKAELTTEASKAGKGAGMLGGAGVSGHLALVFASLALMFGLDGPLALWGAALIIAAIYAVVAAALYLRGRKELAQVDPIPHQTIETLKEPVR
jgi:hypothetical protein